MIGKPLRYHVIFEGIKCISGKCHCPNKEDIKIGSMSCYNCDWFMGTKPPSIHYDIVFCGYGVLDDNYRDYYWIGNKWMEKEELRFVSDDNTR